MRVISALWMLLLAAMGPPAFAQTANSRHIAIDLVPETLTPRAGGELALAFVARPEPGWHGYWRNPGDAGIETQAHWTLPSGVTAGPLQYPVPRTLLISGLMNHVYEGPFVQFATLKLPTGLAVGAPLPIAVKLDYLVCTDEICVPESAEFSTRLTVGDGAITPERRAEFDRWRRALPRPLGAQAHYAVSGDRLRIGIPYPAAAQADAVHFFALTDGVLDYAAPQTVTRQGDMLVVETRAKAGRPPAIEGVLAVGRDDGFAIRAVPGTVARAEATGQLSASHWLIALGGAVLGGLLLNIMPCVFPILSLKALSLARSGGEGARGEAVAYTAGVVFVCLVLGGVLLALRAGGASVGWAFQLQDPRVILLLLLLVMAIALNLAGLFELSAPGAANRLAARGTGSAFLTGALAAFVATPCTGPFMGAALGAALVLPAWGALAIFGGLGLGLALPFLLIGFSPALRGRLPKPGRWMETFRYILSLPMFLTALALAWVLGRQAGVNGMTLGLGAALLVATGLWWTGVRQRRGRSLAWLPGLAAVLIAPGAMALVERAPIAVRAAAGGAAEPFTEARLTALRAEGRPVFAYFTADWCVTCKVNEKAVIETDIVQSALKQHGVAILVGDWTDGDPTLGRFISAHDRAGVPLYLWYGKNARAPEILPQLLTTAMLTDRAAAP